MEISEELAEQILKAMVNWNGQELKFDKKFLEYQNATELIVEDRGDTIVLRTKFK